MHCCLTACVFFNDTATAEIYTLSLHDALPSWCSDSRASARPRLDRHAGPLRHDDDLVGTRRVDQLADLRLDHGQRSDRLAREDRKSTRLNSSHASISYAVFCLKKKKKRLHTL